jgi:RNA polymerase sigma-70 factor, ECF subfamily
MPCESWKDKAEAIGFAGCDTAGRGAMQKIEATVQIERQRDLVELARAGDRDAWEALYRNVYPRLLAYARRRLGSVAASDAVSETMTRAVARIGTFQWQGGGFDAWLFGILRHVVLDVQRRSGRPDPLVLSEPSVAGPLEQVISGEERASLWRAFSRLTPSDRELLELRVMGGLTSEEVAGVLGKKPGAVRMAQQRALARLRDLLESE